MSRLKLLAIVAGLVSFAGTAVAEPVTIQSRLNLRASPKPAADVVALMPAGSRIDVQACEGEWCRVRFGRAVGYASRAYVIGGSEAQASAAPPPAAPHAAASAAESTSANEPRIWTWRDRDMRDRLWRDIEYRNRHR